MSDPDNTFKLFVNELIIIFNNTINTDVINTFILKDAIYRSKINNSKISIEAVIYYIFFSCFINENKITSADLLSDDYLEADRSCYSKKAHKIPYSFFEYLDNQVHKLCEKYYCKKGTQVAPNIWAGDGMNTLDSNFNVALNMGLYDVTNEMPVNLTFDGSDQRNCEVKLTRKYVTEHLDELKNIILLLDAFYYNTDLIELLIQNNIYFVIHGHKNSDNYDINKPIGKVTKKRKIQLNYVRDKLRVITYEKEITKKVIIKRKNTNKDADKGKEYTIMIDETFNLITNLPQSTYDDEKIKYLYKFRWEIETFFKLVKFNFNISSSMRRTDEELKIANRCITIVVNIMKVIKKHVLSKTTKKSTDTHKININETRMILNFKRKRLANLIFGKITIDDLLKFEKKYCGVFKQENNRSFERISKTPHLKWHGKCNSDRSELKLIIEAIENKTVHKLDKNKKTKAKSITIISFKIIK